MVPRRDRKPGESGFLLVDKPEGMTSRRALDMLVRQREERVKAGYEGILDPFAGGLLVVGLGHATRFLRYFHALPKTYTGILRLGIETDTLDPEGRIVARAPVPACSAGMLSRAASLFRGSIEQVPPAYAALRMGGRRGYDIARGGGCVSFPPRRVTVHALVIEDAGDGRLALECTVSAGTYVRAIARDIARALGTVGCLEKLRRTAIGPFSVDDACRPESAANRTLLPMGETLAWYPAAILSGEDAGVIRSGGSVETGAEAGTYRLMGPRGFLGMGACREGRLFPERLLPADG